MPVELVHSKLSDVTIGGVRYVDAVKVTVVIAGEGAQGLLGRLADGRLLSVGAAEVETGAEDLLVQAAGDLLADGRVAWPVASLDAVGVRAALTAYAADVAAAGGGG